MVFQKYSINIAYSCSIIFRYNQKVNKLFTKSMSVGKEDFAGGICNGLGEEQFLGNSLRGIQRGCQVLCNWSYFYIFTLFIFFQVGFAYRFVIQITPLILFI